MAYNNFRKRDGPILQIERKEEINMSIFDHGLAPSRPIPPIGNATYDTTMKFLEAAERECVKEEKPLDPYYDWVIHTLLSSMMVDGPSRIFLPKTETDQFQVNDLFPFSAVPPLGCESVNISNAFVFAPLWNNQLVFAAIEASREKEKLKASKASSGFYIKDLNLAILLSDVESVYFSRFNRQSTEATLQTYSLATMAEVVRTDGTHWFVKENGQETVHDVLEPRMATLYAISLRRHGIAAG